MQFCRTVANQIRHLDNHEIMKSLEKGIAFNLSDNANCALRIFLHFNLNGAGLFQDVLPFLTTVMCCLNFIGIQRMISNFNGKLKVFVIGKSSFKPTVNLATELLQIKETAREINQQLSLLLFLLIGFWTTNICYTISKIIFRPSFVNDFAMFLYILNVCSYICEFVTLVTLAAKTEEEIAESKNILFRFSAGNVGNMFNDAANIQLFASMLDNARHQISVTALGMFKLDRGFMLVILGIIVTYEVLIVQILRQV